MILLTEVQQRFRDKSMQGWQGEISSVTSRGIYIRITKVKLEENLFFGYQNRDRIIAEVTAR